VSSTETVFIFKTHWIVLYVAQLDLNLSPELVLVLIQPSPFSDVTYLAKEDLVFNWCAGTGSGEYPLCVYEIPEEPSGAPISAVNIQSNPSSDGDDVDGLPGWSVALIILLSVSLVGIVGCLIYVAARRRYRAIERRRFFSADDDDDGGIGRVLPRLADTDDWSKTSATIEHASYGSQRMNRGESRTIEHAGCGSRRTKRQSRDPTLYIPSRTGRDPTSGIQMGSDGASSRGHSAEERTVNNKVDP